jgi:hypothetical protein
VIFMSLRTLPPDEAKKKAVANVQRWKEGKRRKALKGRREESEASGAIARKPLRREPLEDHSWMIPKDSYLRVDNEALLACCRELVESEGITTENELARVNLPLFQELKKRFLIIRVRQELQVSRIDYTEMSDEQLVQMARDIIKIDGIQTRDDFYRGNRYLNSELRERGLLDKAFSEE